VSGPEITPVVAGVQTGPWVLLAAQEALAPPLLPKHCQDQGPLPLTKLAAPTLHKLLTGAVSTVLPLALPHTPLTGVGLFWMLALQNASEPLLLPKHFHDQGPLPLTKVAVPTLHKLLLGPLENVPPLEAPQTPFTGFGVEVLLAEQETI
jgi:hypothetical protein